jgi:hypothetical protein
MTLYSFKGHYPVEQIDNNKGWYEVPAKPEVPEGKEVAWLNAEWVVRDPKPVDRSGYQWNWNHSQLAWVECEFAGMSLKNETPQTVTFNLNGDASASVSAAATNQFAVSTNGSST